MKRSRKATGLKPAVEPPPADRIEQVFRWIVEGHTEQDVDEAVAETWPDQAAQPLIVAAVVKLAKAGKLDAGIIRGFCFEAFRELYRKMVEAGDLAGALKAVKEIDEMARRQEIDERVRRQRTALGM